MTGTLADTDLLALRSALLLREHRGLRRASDQLGVNASVLSRRIDGLEAALGVTLFQRTPSGTRVTPAGERFLRDAEMALRLLEAAAARAVAAAAGEEGRLALGYVWPVGGSPAEALLRRFRTLSPGVEIELRRGEPRELTSALLDGRLDLAFLAADEPAPGLIRTPLWRERWLLARSATACAPEDVLLCAGREEMARAARIAQGTPWADLPPRPLAATFDALLSLVAAGVGVAFVPESVAEVRRTQVTFTPLEGPVAPLSICAAWSGGNDNPVLTRFQNLIRDGAGEVDPIRLRQAS